MREKSLSFPKHWDLGKIIIHKWDSKYADIIHPYNKDNICYTLILIFWGFLSFPWGILCIKTFDIKSGCVWGLIAPRLAPANSTIYFSSVLFIVLTFHFMHYWGKL